MWSCWVQSHQNKATSYTYKLSGESQQTLYAKLKLVKVVQNLQE